MMLHYGADYMPYALHSLNAVCDKIIILYSLAPTHNALSGEMLPIEEARHNLKAAAEKYDKVSWVDVYARSEGEHRGKIWDYTNGFDVLVNADADEVWNIDDLRKAVAEVYRSPYRVHGIAGFIHFWRSFRHVVAGCEIEGRIVDEADFFRPIRLWHLREKNTDRQPDINARIYHFGYAIRRRIMIYKRSVHGHRSEWREEWDNIWHNWTPDYTEGNFHPTSYQIWRKIVPFDTDELPEFIRNHPLSQKIII